MPVLMNTILVATALAFLALVGCEQKNDQTTAPHQPPTVVVETAAATGGHGHPGARPGSHQDWCGGHQVPESLCTRCNASLIPAFKATGDWCEEHGLPESQCLICNPDLKIVRPPETGEDSP